MRVALLQFTMHALFRRSLATSVPAQLIKNLRERTGAPILECKKALEACALDEQNAIEWLRKSGLNVANKLSARNTATGLVCAIASKDLKAAAIVELKSETDFVARNEKFQDLLSNITGAVLETQKSGLEITPDSIQSLKTSEFDVQNVMNDVILAIREKIEVGRAAKLQVGNGVVGCYVHNKLKAGVGDNAALVAIEAASYVSQNALEEFSRKLAMHVVAARPKFLSKQSVPKEVIEKEKQILLEQMKELQNKPPAILDKILSGKLGKFYEETCLLEQVYILDDVDGDSDKGKRTISDIVAEKSKELGTELHVSSFVRLRVAEANEI